MTGQVRDESWSGREARFLRNPSAAWGWRDLGFGICRVADARNTSGGSVLLRSVPLTPPQPIEDGDDACKDGHPAVQNEKSGHDSLSPSSQMVKPRNDIQITKPKRATSGENARAQTRTDRRTSRPRRHSRRLVTCQRARPVDAHSILASSSRFDCCNNLLPWQCAGFRNILSNDRGHWDGCRNVPTANS